MLFFELFPLFMLLVCLVVGVRLYFVHREAVAAEEAERTETNQHGETEDRRANGESAR